VREGMRRSCVSAENHCVSQHFNGDSLRNFPVAAPGSPVYLADGPVPLSAASREAAAATRSSVAVSATRTCPAPAGP